MGPPSASVFRHQWEGHITSEARDFWLANGFLVLKGFSERAETAKLRLAADSIVRDPATAPPVSAIFTTDDQTRRMDDAYFLQSSGRVACFREEKWKCAVDGKEENEGSYVSDRALHTNKIGHALHDLNETFACFSYSENVRAVATGLGLSHPAIVQSMYIFKQPRIGGAVNAHRDASFILSEPETCLGFWWALQPSTLQNGCLWAVPGSHKDGISRRMVLSERRDATLFRGEEAVSYSRDRFVPIEMDEGDLILLHGALMHMSLDNTSENSRHAYSIHLVDGLETYSPNGWLQRPAELPFRKLDDPPFCLSK